MVCKSIRAGLVESTRDLPIVNRAPTSFGAACVNGKSDTKSQLPPSLPPSDSASLSSLPLCFLGLGADIE